MFRTYGQIAIAHICHVSQGELPVGFAGAAAYENKFAVVRPIGIEFEKVLDLRRLAIFVDAKKADIEIVPGILEVVRVTAEEGHLLLRRKDQPHVIITFVPVKMVRPALVECDDIRPQSGFIFAFLFNGSDGSVARAGSLIARHAWFQSARNARSYVLDGHQHVQLQIRRFDLIGLRFRIETVPQIIVLDATHLLQCVGANVMVCDDEAIRRNEGSAPARVEANTGLLEMLKPLRRWLELVFFFEVVLAAAR